MSDDTYNGWTNYETWNWKLWMDNDYGTYHYWLAEVGELMDSLTPTEGGAMAVIYALSKRLEDNCETYLETIDVPSLTTGPFADILNAGLNRINWYEIAEHLVEDYDE